MSEPDLVTFNIERATAINKSFRFVIYTSSRLQLVLQSLRPDEEVAKEVHVDFDQFIRVEEGQGEIRSPKNTYSLKPGIAVLIPAGTEHQVKNTGKGLLQFYTIYSKPVHGIHTVEEKDPVTGKLSEVK